MSASPLPDLCAERRELEYVYQDGDGYVLFDPDAAVLVSVPEADAVAVARYLKEGDRVGVLFHAGQPLLLEPPATVLLQVTDLEVPRPGTLAAQLALLETGVKVRVPSFISVGDTVIVDPRTGGYLGRAAPGSTPRVDGPSV